MEDTETPNTQPAELDEEARRKLFAGLIAALYAQHFDRDSDGMSRTIRDEYPDLLDKIVSTQIDKVRRVLARLDIPCIEGSVGGGANSLVFLKKPDLDGHASFLGTGSIAVVDEHRLADETLGGFDCWVRMGTSGTWLFFGIIAPEERQEAPDLYGINDDGDYTHEELARIPIDDINRVAVAVAQAEGFGAVVRSRELRAEFAEPYVRRAFPEREDHDITQAVAQQAASFWEFAVIPERAKALSADGKKTINEIAKLLGITRQRAERAVHMPLAHSTIELMHRYNQAPDAADQQ